MTWQLQDAKNKLSEVIEKAINEGPQENSRRGKKTAILLSIKDYIKLRRKPLSIADFFKTSPLSGLTFERSKDFPRNTDL